jgi:hypothetical protein
VSDRPIETATALAKLARALDVDPAEVDFLAHLQVDDLRTLRGRVDDRLHAADARRLQGVVAASKHLPTPLAATIGEKWFGPVLCARLVGLVEPKRGGQYARHLSVGFMADITARTDPRVVGDLIPELPLRSMQAIAGRLLHRGDHLTLSHFVGHLPAEVVAAILDAIDDNAAVVRIARYVEDLSHLDPVVALLPDERIVALVRAVAAEDLWVDGLHLFSHLGDAQITRIASTLVQQDTDAVLAVLDALERHDLWAQGITLVDHLDPADLVAFADVLLVVDDTAADAAIALIDSVIAALDANDAWDTLVRIAVAADDLSDDVRRRLRTLVDRLPKASVQRFVAAAEGLGHADLLERVLGTVPLPS